MNWTRFTEQSRRVVFFAQGEAEALGEWYVSTEHLLLALVREDGNVATRVLHSLGISQSQVRSEVERIVVQGNGDSNQESQLTPRAKRVIDLAYDEAKKLDDNHIGTEHLLLGLIREEGGVAGLVLRKLGASLEKAQEEVIRLRSSSPGESNSKSLPKELSTADKEIIARKIQRLTASGEITNETIAMLKGLIGIVTSRGEDKEAMMPIFANDLLLLLDHLHVTDTDPKIDEELDESG